MVEVSDRFHLKPLLRAVTFPQTAYVLALAENSVRLVEVSADLPAATAHVPGLPRDAASAVGKSTINDRSPSGRIQGSEGKKVRLRQYVRVGRSGPARAAGRQRGAAGAGRHRAAGGDLPLGEQLPASCRGRRLDGNPETLSDADLAQQARSVLDALHRERIAAWTALFNTREAQGRATTNVANVARAATFGAVDSPLVDIDHSIPGTIDEANRRGHVRPTQAGATSYAWSTRLPGG